MTPRPPRTPPVQFAPSEAVQFRVQLVEQRIGLVGVLHGSARLAVLRSCRVLLLTRYSGMASASAIRAGNRPPAEPASACNYTPVPSIPCY